MIRQAIKDYGYAGCHAELAEQHQGLESDLSCDVCGQLLASEEEAHYLEEVWSTGSSHPVYVCDCEEGKQVLVERFQERSEDFRDVEDLRFLPDGYYDVTGIARAFIDISMYGEAWASGREDIIEALALMELPTCVAAKPYQVDTIIFLERAPKRLELTVIGHDHFGHGACCVIKDAPKEMLILNEND
jgi:hypothetical protein